MADIINKLTEKFKNAANKIERIQNEEQQSLFSEEENEQTKPASGASEDPVRPKMVDGYYLDSNGNKYPKRPGECSHSRYGPEYTLCNGKYRNEDCLDCGQTRLIGRPHP